MRQDNDIRPPDRRPVWSAGDNRIFASEDPRRRSQAAEHAVNETLNACPGVFQHRLEAHNVLARICLPASERWAFAITAKAATTTTLALLFQAEFGVPPPIARLPNDPNPATSHHYLTGHDIFSQALELPRSLPDLAEDPDLERIVVVRHPEDRAASAFEYVCASNDQSKWFFLPDRARMAALFGLDFTTMSRTANGFVRFLEYVHSSIEVQPRTSINIHWRPQAWLCFPNEFRPTLVGRVEAYDTFRRVLFERLDRPQPSGPVRLNSPDRGDRAALYDDPAARRLVREIYALDYEAFGYAPGAAAAS